MDTATAQIIVMGVPMLAFLMWLNWVEKRTANKDQKTHQAPPKGGQG
jgi:hypothetical protein